MSLELVFIITAIVFTGIGWYFGYSTRTKLVVESTIDSLIEAGYLKTRIGPDGKVEVLKHNDK